MKDEPSGYKMEAAMALLMRVRESLVTEDPQLVEDEAELLRLLEVAATPDDEQAGIDAMAVLRRFARAAILSENRAEGCDRLLDQLEARRNRYRRRHERLRAALLDALSALDLKTLSAPDFTVSRRRTPPAVVITEPEKLEDRFVRITRTPMKTELRKAMVEDGEVVEGAFMNNGGETISIKLT